MKSHSNSDFTLAEGLSMTGGFFFSDASYFASSVEVKRVSFGTLKIFSKEWTFSDVLMFSPQL